MSVIPLLNKINEFILNPLIMLAFAIALLYFFWGVFQFIKSETSDKGREQGKSRIMFGLLGMLIMFSAYGIVRLILNTFGITPNPYPGF